jgi:hypothetical protein
MFELVGAAMTMMFATVDGRRVAASRWNGRRWERWAGLTGGRHTALLRELNRSGRHPSPLRPMRDGVRRRSQ